MANWLAAAALILAMAQAVSSPLDYTQWRVDVGEGYSGPLVGGTTVYTFTRRGSDEVLTALDAGTGAVRWRTSYAASYTVDDAAAKHGADDGLFTSPVAATLDGVRQVVTVTQSAIIGVSRDGAVLWKHPFRNNAAARRSEFTPAKTYTVGKSATWAHPAVSGNRIFVKDTTSLTSWTVR